MTGRRLDRRGALAVLAAGAALPVLAGCGGDGGKDKGKDKDTAASATEAGAGGGGPSVLMIIRHAEKPTGSGAPYGITSDGVQDSHSLTVQGWTRAGALVGLFDPRDSAGGPAAPRSGLTRPTTVAAAEPGTGGSNSKRPEETVTPLAAALGTELNTRFSLGQESALVSWLTGSDGPSGPTLVAWEHQHIPDIIDNLGRVSPAPPGSWPADRFDVVYVFTRASGGGWTFTQVPQMLLAGDSPTPIG